MNDIKHNNTNQILSDTFKQGANAFNGTGREDLIKNFSENLINKCWEVFSQYILKNYQMGKGTYIPKFGVFTFANIEYSLEGTTNQFERDLKPRKPVFLSSSDFVEFLKPGIFTPKGVVQYTQKQNNNIPLIKINFTELAMAVNISKVEYFTIIENIIKYIGDKIHKGEFKNKEMPGLGILICRGNVIAVKFNGELNEYVKLIPQKLIQTKKEVNLFMDVTNKEKLGKKPISNVVPNNLSKTLAELRPKTSVLTKITADGENWLKQNLGIDIDNLDKDDNASVHGSVHGSVHSSNSVDNRVSKRDFNSTTWINDVDKKKKIIAVRLEELGAKPQVLEALYFHKNLLINEMKKKDKNLTGLLKKIEVVEAFNKANISDEIGSKFIYDLLNIYGNSSSVDYIKFMAGLLKDIRGIIFNKILGLCGFNDTMRKSFNMTSMTSRIQTQQSGVNEFRNSLSKSQTEMGAKFKKDQKVELKDVQHEIRTIKSVFALIKQSNATTMEQNISHAEFARMLREYNIVYPKEKLFKILSFLDIVPYSFNMRELAQKMDECKIIFNEVNSDDISNTLNAIKDIVFSLKNKNELFTNKKSITKEEFTRLIVNSGTNLSELFIQAAYNYITKTDRNMTQDEFTDNFMKKPDQDFETRSIRMINERLNKKNFNTDEYYDKLLAYKVHKDENKISNYDFHKAMGKEKYGFSAEEIEALFKILDTKKDGFIDREEFNEKVRSVYEPLFRVRDIILKNELEIEDILFRMQINPKINEQYDFFKFKAKMRYLDNSLDHHFIHSLFLRLKGNKETVDTKSIETEFNVFKKESFRDLNSDSFKKNFMTFIKNSSNYYTLKQGFESIDSFGNGLLEKVDFCNMINKTLKNEDYKDEDIMKFIRIAALFKDNKVRYPEFLDLIFFDNKADGFYDMLNILNNHLQLVKGDIKALINVVNAAKFPDYIDINSAYNFLKSKMERINKNTVCKLDLDQDGKISKDDIKNILERYLRTSFFKYENNESDVELNIYPPEEISEDRFKQIVKDIKVAMKNKNLTDVGLFHKLDGSKAGFISHSDFNKNIDDVLKLAPSIKDQFFSRLDNRKLGMVDMDTFMKLFKEFTNREVVVKNNWEVENKMFDDLKKYIRDNMHLSDNEVFMGMDFDYDGNISLEDFKRFVLEKLKFSENDINKFKLERVLQQISLTKDTNLTMFDIKEFVNKIKTTNEFDLKQNVMRLTKSTSNLHPIKKENNDWIDAAIERLGLYVSSKWDTIEAFFTDYSNRTDRIKIDDFIKFSKDNFHCYEGFNFSEDEIIVIFTALDPHKKSYVTLDDLQNKISQYNFYKKMHSDIKNFMMFSLKTGVETFKYFSNDISQGKTANNFNNYVLNKKEVFDGINSLFPKKFTTNQVLTYMSKYFKDPEKIEFSELNYLYFDKAEKNEYLSSRIRNSQLAKPRATSAHQHLSTPYDKDPIEKVKRLLKASKFDMTSFFKMYDIISNGFLNPNEFANMLKKMNLGLTLLEIEAIIKRVSRNTENLLNLREFIAYMNNTDPNIKQMELNINKFLGEIKNCIYKYYANPRLAFQFNDDNNVQVMNFDKFRSLVNKLFQKESKPLPNFSLIKNGFEFIDVRKDGIIDINEWLRTFTYQEASLDVRFSNKNESVVKELREWENSKEVSNVYAFINQNRKLIREKAKNYIINKSIINSENLISILESVSTGSKLKMSKTQWKILVAIADRERNGLIDFELFMNLSHNSAKIVASHPKFQF